MSAATMLSKKPSIISLASSSSTTADFSEESLRVQLASALRGSGETIVPGKRPEDKAYSYKRSVPTILLYDEQGLLWYDDITQGNFYYPFRAELEILQSNGEEIARRMFGLPTGPKVKERWGDARVGLHNNGVNGEHYGSNGEHSEVRGTVVELGAGSLRKTSHLLSAIGKLNRTQNPVDPPIKYHALDLDRSELERTLHELSNATDLGLHGKVAVGGLEGTYEMGFEWLRLGGAGGDVSPPLTAQQLDQSIPLATPPSSRNGSPDRFQKSGQDEKLCILHLGSSLGNYSRTEAVEFLRTLGDSLRPGIDTLLMGLDSRNEKKLVERAYNDEGGITRQFIMHGLERAGKVLAGNGSKVSLDPDNFEYVARYNEVEGRHEAYYRAKLSHFVVIPSASTGEDKSATPPEVIELAEGELLHVEWSYKYSDSEVHALLSAAGLRPVQSWKDSGNLYGLWLVERPAFSFPSSDLPSWAREGGQLTREQGVPSVKDWEDAWRSWDAIREMVPKEMLHQKPIDLRHIVLFYFGHIPAFLDIHLSRFLEEPHTEPEHFKDIFERGIDPSMEDPTKCHAHSIVPEKEDDWPKVEAILDFDQRVRERVLRIYEDIEAGRRPMNRRLGRMLFMTYEHILLHAETLLYMLLQRAGTGTLPPPGFAAPDWSSLSRTWDAIAAAEAGGKLLSFSAQRIELGHVDVESQDGAKDAPNDPAAWEHEYGWDCENPTRDVDVKPFKIRSLPISNGEFRDFLKKKGSDYIPPSWVKKNDEIEVRTFYGPVPFAIGQHWPCIAPATQLADYAAHVGGRLPTEAEIRVLMRDPEQGVSCDHPSANVGFQHWHPVPAESAKVERGGRVRKGHNGGVWEWTSTDFAAEGEYEASALYPGYSSDFFDGTHAVVLGGSYATPSRIAGRWSFRNWYQHGYGYCWAGARVAYDA